MPDEIWNPKKSKKSNSMNSIGFDTNMGDMKWGNQKDNINSSVWNYNDPFGFSGKPKRQSYRKSKGRRTKQSQSNEMDMGFGNIINFTQDQMNRREKAKTAKKQKPIANRPRNMPTRYDSGNVLLNTIQGLNERLSRREEQKRFDSSQPYTEKETKKGKYIVKGTDNEGRPFTEYYDAPNTAYSAQQKYRSKGWSVDAIRIDR